MMNSNNHASHRRQFLKFLSASPYIAAGGGLASFLNSEGFAQDVRESSFVQIMRDRMSVVANPKEALTVFDMEATARTKVHQGHWSYMASGTDDDATLFANRDGFRQIKLRPRRLRDATKDVLDTLTPREAKVLRMRFGIEMNTDHTLEEVGKQFDVTRERIRQIEAKALRKLKHPSRSRKLRAFLEGRTS